VAKDFPGLKNDMNVQDWLNTHCAEQEKTKDTFGKKIWNVKDREKNINEENYRVKT